MKRAVKVVVLAVAVYAVVVVAKKYLSPGAYVSEIPDSQLPIPGVGTSTVGHFSDDPK